MKGWLAMFCSGGIEERWEARGEEQIEDKQRKGQVTCWDCPYPCWLPPPPIGPLFVKSLSRLFEFVQSGARGPFDFVSQRHWQEIETYAFLRTAFRFRKPWSLNPVFIDVTLDEFLSLSWSPARNLVKELNMYRQMELEQGDVFLMHDSTGHLVILD